MKPITPKNDGIKKRVKKLQDLDLEERLQAQARLVKEKEEDANKNDTAVVNNVTPVGSIITTEVTRDEIRDIVGTLEFLGRYARHPEGQEPEGQEPVATQKCCCTIM